MASRVAMRSPRTGRVLSPGLGGYQAGKKRLHRRGQMGVSGLPGRVRVHKPESVRPSPVRALRPRACAPGLYSRTGDDMKDILITAALLLLGAILARFAWLMLQHWLWYREVKRRVNRE